jgi:hypothetical protein
LSGQQVCSPPLSILRAPREDGGVVARPPLEEVGRLLDGNLELWSATPPLLGLPWIQVRQEARAEILARARHYLSSRGEPLPPAETANHAGPLLLAGHQPELFHPGVWVKNFALAGLARVHQGIALNLLIDSDTVKTTRLRFPAPGDEHTPYPHLASLSFESRGGEVPYEERAISDPRGFSSFADRVDEILAPWGYEPLLPAFWEEVKREMNRGSLLGECFAAARRTLERAWGCHNLEVPISTLCATRAFARFALHLLAGLPRFHDIYNASLWAYRRAHGLRSRNHPVPDLAQDKGWREVPLWAWKAELEPSRRRGRLFARLCPEGIELRAGQEAWPTLPWPDPGQPEPALRAWQDLAGQGYKIRPRALATTLFARLFLGDLFLHGLGGGKYDELTDELIRCFYDLKPPAYVVLSATRLLPLPLYPVEEAQRKRLAQQLRDTHHNPQRHLGPLGDDPDLQPLLAERQFWVEQQPATRTERRQRARKLKDLKAQLRAPLGMVEHQLAEQLHTCEQELQANAILGRRDYAFCLYPESLLRPFCQSFL